MSNYMLRSWYTKNINLFYLEFQLYPPKKTKEETLISEEWNGGISSLQKKEMGKTDIYFSF